MPCRLALPTHLVLLSWEAARSSELAQGASRVIILPHQQHMCCPHVWHCNQPTCYSSLRIPQPSPTTSPTALQAAVAQAYQLTPALLP